MSRDLIDRQTVIDALEHVISHGVKSNVGECHFLSAEGVKEYVLSLPSAQPDLQPTCNQLAKDTNVPCKDTISRQDAIDMIMGQPPEAHYPSWYAEQIKALPSAQPESETGTWIWKHHVWWCSECGKNPTKGMGYVQGAEELFDYCPHCGKKMEGVQM